MKLKLITCFLLAIVCSFTSFADVLKLRENHPKTYTVVKGDTLWGISTHFLNTPWLWPRLWQANSQIENPHLIYPGDQLTLIWINGEPRLTRKQLKKLSPTPRLTEKIAPIPTIPLIAISAFLSKDHVIDAKLLATAPRLLGDALGTPAFFAGDTFYGMGKFNAHRLYGVYRLQGEYIDPETEESLGSALTFIGHARVSTNPDVTATEQVTPLDFLSSTRDARQGDLILAIPEYDSLPVFFLPQSVSPSVQGNLIASTTTASVMGRWDTVIINLGNRDNIKIGSMFSILQAGPHILFNKDEDTIKYLENGSLFEQKNTPDIVLPAKKVGELMVFKTYEKVSIALIMRTSEIITTKNTIQGIAF